MTTVDEEVAKGPAGNPRLSNGSRTALTDGTAALVLSINAALTICLLECAHFLLTAHIHLPALGYIPVSLITLAVALGLLLGIVVVGLRLLERAFTRRQPLWTIAVGLVLLPQAWVTFAVFSPGHASAWLSVLVLALEGAATTATVWRTRPAPGPLLVACGTAAVATLRIQRQDYTLARAGGGSIDVYYVYAHVLPLCGIAAAVGGYLVLRHCQGRSLPRWLAWPAGLAGIVACYLLVPLLPLNTRAAIGFLRGVATIFIVLGATRLLLIRRARLALPLGAAAVATQIYLYNFAGDAQTGWAITHNTVLAATAAENTRVFRRFADDREARFKLQPQYRAGLEILQTARRWNALANSQPRATSVLLVTVDALRFDAVQYSGRAQADWTPNLNRLASRCHRFHSAYAQGGWTSISLPSLIWSKYPRLIRFVPLYEDNENGLHWSNQPPQGRWIEKRFQSPIREPDPNLAKILDRRGYHTVAVTNDEFTGYFAPELGFTKDFADVAYPKTERDRRTDAVGREANLDAVAADITIERIRQQRDRPTFIWTHLFSPHGPYEPPTDTANPFEGYHGEVYYADLQLGRILRELDRSGQRQNTLVIVTADHGESFWEHHNNTHGKELYDHAMRVPLLVCLPDAKADDVQQPVGLIDIGPTILDYLGVPIPSSMQGFTLRRLIERDPTAKRPAVYLETWQNEPKTLDHELNRIAVVDGNFKLLLDVRWHVFSLFDLSRDPAEKRNLLEETTPEIRNRYQELGGSLLGWRDAAGAPLPPEHDAR